MKKILIELPEMKLVGIKARTNNKSEFNQETAKIFPCIQRYQQLMVPQKITHPKNPGITFCAYTEYESDHMGDYTFFIGQEVTDLTDVAEELETLITPPQRYVKFTTESGPMPMVVINAWQKIWQMSAQELGGERSYHTDFEFYDARASDPQNAVVDIYIGIKK